MGTYLKNILSLSKSTCIWQEVVFAIVVEDQSTYAQWMQPQFQ